MQANVKRPKHHYTKDGRLHPFRQFSEGWLKREPVPSLGRETLKGVTKPNRAR